MNLDIINSLINNAKDSQLIENFTKEVSNYLLKELDGKENSKLQEDNTNLIDLREEGCLYQVVDKSLNGVYLQNTKNNKVFEETDIPQDIQDEIDSDYILRYQDGTYIVEEELTEEFFNSMLSTKEYEEMRDSFLEDNHIRIEEETRFSIAYREEDNTVLNYENNKNKQLEVPNALLPFFIYDDTILCYKNGKFEKEM